MCCTCVPTIICCTTCSVHRKLFIVSCSDSNRIVASKQSLVQITYACSLWFCLNRCAFFVSFIAAPAIRNMYSSFSIWLPLPERNFSAQVPSYFCIKANRNRDRISSVLFKWIDTHTRTYTCQYVCNCTLCVHVMLHIMYTRLSNKLAYYKSGELNCLPT